MKIFIDPIVVSFTKLTAFLIVVALNSFGLIGSDLTSILIFGIFGLWSLYVLSLMSLSFYHRFLIKFGDPREILGTIFVSLVLLSLIVLFLNLGSNYSGCSLPAWADC